MSMAPKIALKPIWQSLHPIFIRNLNFIQEQENMENVRLSYHIAYTTLFTTGLAFFVECLRHSSKAILHSAN
jgi:hypothetical protein